MRRGLVIAWFAFAALSCAAQAQERPQPQEGAQDGEPEAAARAAALDAAGDRPAATELLGRHLASAPDDGVAWLQLGRLYLLDARDWHRDGHQGRPDGLLYLDVAATALDESVRLAVDSALVTRGIVEMERMLAFAEDSGWQALRERQPPARLPRLPPVVVELGRNILKSCPADGVLVTGNDLETISVWFLTLDASQRADILPVRADRYLGDERYRGRMAAAMAVDSGLPLERALAVASTKRSVCFTPGVTAPASLASTLQPYLLVRVTRSVREADGGISITELLNASRNGETVWTLKVRSVYSAAARYDSGLCRKLLVSAGATSLPSCEP